MTKSQALFCAVIMPPALETPRRTLIWQIFQTDLVLQSYNQLAFWASVWSDSWCPLLRWREGLFQQYRLWQMCGASKQPALSWEDKSAVGHSETRLMEDQTDRKTQTSLKKSSFLLSLSCSSIKKKPQCNIFWVSFCSFDFCFALSSSKKANAKPDPKVQTQDSDPVPQVQTREIQIRVI